MWENEMNINEVKEIRVKTTAYLGVGAIEKIDDILAEMAKRGNKSCVLVTGKNSYKSSGAWAAVEPALKKHGFKYAIYDEVKPNPDVHQVNAALKLAKSIDADTVMGIGGGSPIDAAKAVACLLKYPNETAETLASLTVDVRDAAPIIAINLTHGTGTEVDRFSVITIPEQEFKPALAYEAMYPAFAIDDPALMVSLGKAQSTYVSIDAVNHVTEAATTLTANPLAVLTAGETIRLVAKYLPRVRENGNDMEARYYLAYAALIAGTSFDNGLLHLTHAMEHPLSAVKTDLTHGLGLAILLPAVVKAIFDERRETILSIYAPILGEYQDDINADEVAQRIRAWLASVGVTETLKDIGFEHKDVEKLTHLAFNTPGLGGLLGCAPVKADEALVSRIYEESL
ncbi:alcohol dehydrogenase [Clostridiaceae bacterium JG1575]|nr:alcohol dehydrogenase [Clostridiaceae bacterium JG1575]